MKVIKFKNKKYGIQKGWWIFKQVYDFDSGVWWDLDIIIEDDDLMQDCYVTRKRAEEVLKNLKGDYS